MIFTTAEGWGGPYSLGAASNMPMRLFGVAILYVIVLAYVWTLYNPLDLVRNKSISREPASPRRHAD